MAEMRTDRASAKLRFFFCNSKNINSNKRNKHVILNCDIPNTSARMGSCITGAEATMAAKLSIFAEGPPKNYPIPKKDF
jgi:hypothetical protein